MTKRQKDILALIRNIHTMESWDQRYYYNDKTRTIEHPCGTSCCLAGHLINQFGTQKEKRGIFNYGNQNYAGVAETIIVQSFGCDEKLLWKANPWYAKNGKNEFACFAHALEESLKGEAMKK